MWKEFTPEGTLAWGNFLDTVKQIIPMYAMRALGGTLFFVGVCIGVYNLIKTAGQGSFMATKRPKRPPANRVQYQPPANTGTAGSNNARFKCCSWSTILIAIGGIVQIIPMVFVESQVPKISTVKPYTPLELTGRDIYIRKVA
jgi:cytochrome c oxidase cbb3-type subunit I/II